MKFVGDGAGAGSDVALLNRTTSGRVKRSDRILRFVVPALLVVEEIVVDLGHDR